MDNKRTHIRAIDETQPGESEATIEASEVPAPEPAFAEEAAADWYEEPVPVNRARWIAPAIGLLVILGWTGFFAYVHRADMQAGGDARQWIGWTRDWAIPIVLVLAVWLLALRTSTREAARFGDAASLLAAESARLEDRLVAVNRELSLAREFLTAQSRDLEFLGRNASERISEHADRLQGLVQTNGAQVDAIAGVSVTALENMNRLRDNLPVIANSTRDVANQIGAAGRTSQSQLAELIAGLERLNEFGSASERQVMSLRKRVDDAITAFTTQADQLAAVTERRFAELREQGDVYRGELDSREVEALAALRARGEALRMELAESHQLARADEDAAHDALTDRLAVLRVESANLVEELRTGEADAIAAWEGQIEGVQQRLTAAIAEIQALDERALESARAKLAELRSEAEAVDASLAERDSLFHAEVASRRDQFSAEEDRALAQMQTRLAALDSAVAERREAHLAQMARMAEEGEALGTRIAALGDQFAAVAGQGEEARTTLALAIDALNAKLIEGREALDGTDMAVAALTDASVRLLELIQASERHTRENLPVAMAASEERLQSIEQRAAEVRSLLEMARVSGEAVMASMEGADSRGREAMAAIEEFQLQFRETAAAQVSGIETLRSGVAALNADSETLAVRIQGDLRAAILALETNARQALASLETEQTERLQAIADTVGTKSAEAIDRAIAERTGESVAKLDEAAQAASDAARDALRHLREQLGKVHELTGNLEARVARARERAEEQVDHDFSRRVALITESLNSNAIDITKALSTDVTDTAWAGYLRGDRGIFTRRAVRLLDNGEVRQVAELYDGDHDFREHVNRYIHDFEAMLRVMLSTRDGNALSVTILSSDMGKLYVALAQAIERLRQ